VRPTRTEARAACHDHDKFAVREGLDSHQAIQIDDRRPVDSHELPAIKPRVDIRHRRA
jgi:hypothetical protein